MLADISILPLDGTTHTSETLAEALKAIEATGIAYQLTPTSTCLEGSWDDIMRAARACHDAARRRHSHLVVELRIEDDGSERSKLRRNIESVEEHAGKPLHKQSPFAGEVVRP